MSYNIEVKEVITRKPHTCFGCRRGFPAGTKMEYRSWVDDGWAHGWFCQTCVAVEQEYAKEGFFEYCQGELREDALIYESRGTADAG